MVVDGNLVSSRKPDDLPAFMPRRSGSHGEELNQRLAGYKGSMTLLDRENARGFVIGLYDTAAHAREVDAIMDQGPPSEMPEELRETLMRGTRSHRGVYEVVQGDGGLGVSS